MSLYVSVSPTDREAWHLRHIHPSNPLFHEQGSSGAFRVLHILKFPLPLSRPTDIFTVGLDRSIKLLQIARTAGGSQQIREVVWGDVLDHGWRPGVFDYAISIATIHHLATHERRIQAVQRLLENVSPRHGRILIYIWAIEQDELSTRKVIGDDEANLQDKGRDVIIPWVLASQKGTHTDLTEHQVFNRYYHMFAKIPGQNQTPKQGGW
ncbi:hypothetical protein C0993_006555 [Termitomyces sp. T159_Od127]|nr:hypothetical protein C0993_006555 [Termitomyces sp. T159_Od127]